MLYLWGSHLCLVNFLHTRRRYYFLCAPVHIQTSAHSSTERKITNVLSIFLINNKGGPEVSVLWSLFETEVAINICCTSLACSVSQFYSCHKHFLFAPRICYWLLVFMSLSPLLPSAFCICFANMGYAEVQDKKISQLKYLFLLFQASMLYLNIIRCTSISSREVLLGPVCTAFLGCQQMEKVWKSLST